MPTLMFSQVVDRVDSPESGTIDSIVESTRLPLVMEENISEVRLSIQLAF